MPPGEILSVSAPLHSISCFLGHPVTRICALTAFDDLHSGLIFLPGAD